MARFKRVTTTGSHFTVFLEEERLLDEEVFLRGLEEEEEEEEEEEDAPTSPAFLFFAAVFLVGIVYTTNHLYWVADDLPVFLTDRDRSVRSACSQRLDI